MLWYRASSAAENVALRRPGTPAVVKLTRSSPSGTDVALHSRRYRPPPAGEKPDGWGGASTPRSQNVVSVPSARSS